MSFPDVEILLPVHNEAKSIESTIREIHKELSAKINVGFIICEDGSTDGTREILKRLAAELPLRLNVSAERKGYSRAVREGMQMLQGVYLLCLDSDGQCDPKDFWSFWEARSRCDIALGWRVKRADPLTRRAFSRVFHLLYRIVLRVPVRDPSCPYVLAPRGIVTKVVGQLGAMEQGFWWEFVARVHRSGYRILEFPVNHRLRAAGVTQVYKWPKMPGIFFRHVTALFRVRRETPWGSAATLTSKRRAAGQ
jgi:glycosyltransferase involved in cell wall biosynthesis